MPKTRQSKFRLSEDIICQIDHLMDWLDLDSKTDVVRHAISWLFHDTLDKHEKKMKKAEKTA